MASKVRCCVWQSKRIFIYTLSPTCGGGDVTPFYIRVPYNRIRHLFLFDLVLNSLILFFKFNNNIIHRFQNEIINQSNRVISINSKVSYTFAGVCSVENQVQFVQVGSNFSTLKHKIIQCQSYLYRIWYRKRKQLRLSKMTISTFFLSSCEIWQRSQLISRRSHEKKNWF